MVCLGEELDRLASRQGWLVRPEPAGGGLLLQGVVLKIDERSWGAAEPLLTPAHSAPHARWEATVLD